MKRERGERDITLVSEQHTKHRLNVSTAGWSTVQSTDVCRVQMCVDGEPPLDQRLKTGGQFHRAGCVSEGREEKRGKWGEGGETGGRHNIQ